MKLFFVASNVILCLFIILFFNRNCHDFSNFTSLSHVDGISKKQHFKDLMTKKYVTARYDLPGRLGNILFRFASLYGIGRKLNRYPYFHANNSEQIEKYRAIADAFPLLSEYIEIKVPNISASRLVDFSDDCCKYEDPLHLKIYDDVKYLIVKANYLHSYGFFHQYRNEIKTLMECSDLYKNDSKKIAKEIWKNDPGSHKLCIHVRREDFVQNIYFKETTADFIIPATKFIYDNLKHQQIAKISLTILNNDEIFSRNLTFPDLSFTSINVLHNNSAALDMCFASTYCDSFLISASVSTFAWWTGYLMEKQNNIYYNAIMSKVEEVEKTFFKDDLFLPHWKRLKIINNHITLVENVQKS